MLRTAAFNVADRVFDSWLIHDCVDQKNEYMHYLVKSENGENEASLWVVDFPASDDDYTILMENGMTEEQAVEFFRQAADDFVGSIQKYLGTDACPNLLAVDAVKLLEPCEGNKQQTVLILTKKVRSLQSIIDHYFFSQEETVRLGMHLCTAVSYIKNNELPRRLITIDNIFVDEDGVYSLGCFGSEADTRFLSPEEHRGESTVYNGDVHSIGVILYTLLNANRLPLLPQNLQNPTEDDIADAVQNRHAGIPLPPPRNSSAALTGIVLKACAYKAKSRFSDVDELMVTLECLRSGRVVVMPADAAKNEQPKPVDKKIIKNWISIAITAVVVLIVSHFLINLFSDSTVQPSQTVEKTTSATDGFTVIYHTDPAVVQTQPSGSDAQQATPDSGSAGAATAQYPDAFYSQIKAYHTGHYHMVGVMEKDGEKDHTEIAMTTQKSVYMTTDMDGAIVGILRDPNGDFYLVNPTGKTCLALSSAVMKLMGMSTDDIENGVNQAMSNASFNYPDETATVIYRERELICCSYYYDNGKIERFYLTADGVIVYIESYSADGALDNTLEVTSFSDQVPAEYISPTDDYTKYNGVSGMLDFVSSLPARNQ